MAVEFIFDPEKTVEAILFLANQSIPGLTKYKICKLLILADKHHLVRFGRTITGDRIRAMEHGPVPSATLDMLNHIIDSSSNQTMIERYLAERIAIDRNFQYPWVVAIAPYHQDYLSDSDIEALRSVIDMHGRKSFLEMKSMTHEMIAYKKAWEQRLDNAPTMAFEDFFDEDEDALVGAYQEMIETSAMKKVFNRSL